MLINYIIVICGYISVTSLLACVLAKIDMNYIDLKIKKDLTKIFIRLWLLTFAIAISVSYTGLLLKLLKMI